MSGRKIFIRTMGGVLGLICIGWLGTRFQMSSFASPPLSGQALTTIPKPTHLPPPVQRYVEVAFEDEIPVIESALVMGKAHLTFNGITFPARFKFYYTAGRAYYHYIQLGWFGQPILTVHERYQDGTAILDIPGGLVENDSHTNAAANLGLWAEGVWLPSMLFTDARVRWEALDEYSARLIVPEAAAQEAFVVQFDPQNGLIAELRTQRYREAGAASNRLTWINRALKWERLNGVMVPVVAELQWGDDAPWAVWEVETILYNVDVSARLAQFGEAYQD